MKTRIPALASIALAFGCAHLLPATWRSYEVDPAFARPAIITAMKSRHLPLFKDNPGETEIETEWTYIPAGAIKARERFRVSWEYDFSDKLLFIYVRHERQEEQYDGFKRDWSSSSHDAAQERSLLDEIERALTTLHQAVQGSSS